MTVTEPTSPTDAFRAARDILLRHRKDYDGGLRGLRLAAPRALQLGAGLVRRHRRRQRPHRPAHRRGGRQRAPATPSPRCAPAPTRSPTGCAHRAYGAGRPHPRHARQPGRAVGDRARRDEAARRRHPRHPAARPRRPARPDRPRPGPACHRAGRGHRQVRRGARRLHPDRGRRRQPPRPGWLAYEDAYGAPGDVRARRRRPAPTTP